MLLALECGHTYCNRGACASSSGARVPLFGALTSVYDLLPREDSRIDSCPSEQRAQLHSCRGGTTKNQAEGLAVRTQLNLNRNAG